MSRRSGRAVARRITVTGRVQGVGYRPFVFHLARRLDLKGWVRNGCGQVLIHVEGRTEDVMQFEGSLTADAPSLARARIRDAAAAPPEGVTTFRILESDADDLPEIHLLPDIVTCDQCLEELRESRERRHRYAFINCTQCGPRYTIIQALPYDRPNTSMERFRLCEACLSEYRNPLDRRFHAQPLACPACGPRLVFKGDEQHQGDGALSAAVEVLRSGGILAVKGIGGYHLLCDAANDAAVRRLRSRKRRPCKPLAVMFPMAGTDGLDAVADHVQLMGADARACRDTSRPIVLARKRPPGRLSCALAPGLAELGVLLPYSPLHHLLLDDFGGPVVATSANVSGEPVITENAEAEGRLGSVADAFLHHDRTIVRPADDPVVRVIGAKARAIRLGRGIAPLELDLPARLPAPILAVGGHMKNTIALGWERRAVVSPHIGDLDSPRSLEIFERVIADIQQLYDVEAAEIVCDAHPGYASTRWAASRRVPLRRILHHHAHASALAAENPQIDHWLIFAWDGTGYGADGTLWGGEGFVGRPGRWRRMASIRPFHLMGGDRAGWEPWRSAAALMWETGRNWSGYVNHGAHRDLAREAWRRRVNTLQTSSVGRLFDAAASLIAGIDIASFEGQGPMMLESLADRSGTATRLPLYLDEGILRFDWEPLLPILTDLQAPAERRAAAFHQTLADALVDQVLAIRHIADFEAVGLTGGVFQNRLLCELIIDRLSVLGVAVRVPEIVPANDGGLAFGQLVEALFSSVPADLGQGALSP